MCKTAGIWFWFLWILKLHDCCQLAGQEIWTQTRIFFSGFCDINGIAHYSNSSRFFPFFPLLVLVGINLRWMNFIQAVFLIFDRKASLEYFKAVFEHSAGLYIIFLSDSFEMNLTPTLWEQRLAHGHVSVYVYCVLSSRTPQSLCKSSCLLSVLMLSVLLRSE